jgi:hypothetical protein
MSHAAFMEAFPCIANAKDKVWLVGEAKIHHGCIWCRDYSRIYKKLNPPRRRKKNLSFLGVESDPV